MLQSQGHKLPVRKGFTLIELLVVIAIIGLLSTIAVVSLNSAREKGRDAKRVADVRQVQTALELYNDGSNGNGYPGDKDAAGATDGLNLGATGAKTLSATNGFADTASGDVYMGLVPTDPLSTQNYVYQSTTATGTACDGNGPCLGYEIRFTLEGEVGGLSGAICASEAGVQQGANCAH